MTRPSLRTGLRGPRRRCAFTLVEVLVAVGVAALAFTVVAQMLQSGSTGMTYAMWHRDRLADSQRFLSALERDLKAAGDAVSIDISTGSSDDQIRVSSVPFTYSAGGGSEPIEDPVTGAVKPLPVVKAEPGEGGAGGAAQPLFSFAIQRAEVLAGPERRDGFRLQATAELRGTELLYGKKLASGSLAGSDETAHEPRAALRDLDFVHVSHTDIVSKFSDQVEGAVVYIYFKFKNPNRARGGEMGFSARQSFKIKTRAVRGGAGGGS